MVQKFFDGVMARTILYFIPRSVLPNYVTTVRFILIPPLGYLLLVGEWRWALAIFIIAALTDAADGAMARTRNQITEWGELYDPLADKLLISTVVGILAAQYLGVYISVLVIGIELLLILEAWRRKLINHIRVKALTVGKLKMVAQVLATIALFLFILSGWPIFLTAASWLFYIAIALAITSLFVYGSI